MKHIFFGAPVVIRYLWNRKIHLAESQPNLPDLDFPRCGIRINPSKYVVLPNQRKRAFLVDIHLSHELKIKKRSRLCDTQLLTDIKQYTIMVNQQFYSP